MGVTGLWTVVRPCARPIKLETLNRRRLAVDASIWIYQFLKAVRDKEGNALRNAHVVGFFRRICKLLFFGIKPVFVFDGGAPSLKRETIAARRKRREGHQEDATRTAEKLLAVQVQRLAEEEDRKRRERAHNRAGAEEEVPENPVYVDEIGMSQKEKQKNRRFLKQDAYHLPELQVSFAEMGAPSDPRIMSHEELEEYARQFNTGEDVNLYDFSKIDFDGPFFQSLPASDRYNILSAARLRSRLRMGYSKEQLDTMFPDRMAFSKFQIDRVKERNDLTQRLLNINGMGDENYATTTRIAGEKDREYVLVKDDDVEGGWALGILSNKDEGRENKPIDVDQFGSSQLPEATNDSGEDDDFEDVPVEGLNRLPKLPLLEPGAFDKFINEQKQNMECQRTADEYDDSLFVGGPNDLNSLFKEPKDEEEEDLRRAIQMSLGTPDDDLAIDKPAWSSSSVAPIAPQKKEPEPAPAEDEDDEMDLFAALAKAKITKPHNQPAPTNPFAGSLPSGSKKFSREDPVFENAGGFERGGAEKEKPKAATLPPWFVQESQQKPLIEKEPEDQYSEMDLYQESVDAPILQSRRQAEIINVDEESEQPELIDLGSPASQKASQVGLPAVSSSAGPQVAAADTILESQRHTCAAAPQDLVATAVESHQDQDAAVPESPSQPGTVQQAYEPTERQNIEESGAVKPSPENNVPAGSRSSSPELEDVEISTGTVTAPINEAPPVNELEASANPRYDDQYSDPGDDELPEALAAEAEEHARFASTLNSKSEAQNAYDWESELKQLRSQHARDRRDADEVSQIMVAECQQLLRLFGIPYITAPMEAEAQCAQLVALELVDGIVTDDSDTFLFGGTRVYKNMFNQAKFVECYLADDLEKEYGLDRQKLIRFAHLLGSDYTEGIMGVGPVTALEILSEFSTLEEFRDWWTQAQQGIQQPDDAHSTFRKRFKKNLAKFFLPPGFPDRRVDQAYLEPEVDADPSAFQWGVPDLPSIRQFLMSTVGWGPERTDEVLIPVIRDINRRDAEGTQANITNFYSGQLGVGVFAPRRRAGPDGQSRMERAFGRLARRQRAGPKKDDGGAGRSGGHGESDVNGTEDGDSDSACGAQSSADPALKPQAPKRAAGKRRNNGDAAGKRKRQRPSTSRVE